MSAPGAPATSRVDAALQHDIEQFLYVEADLLDCRRFDDWLELFSADASYVMPLRVTRESQVPDQGGAGRVFADNRDTLGIRVRRLGTEYAWAEQPASRTRHLVANVRISPTAVAGEYEVASNILVYRNRGDDPGHDLYAGSRVDLLRHTDSGWRIAGRRVLLDQANIAGNSLSIFF